MSNILIREAKESDIHAIRKLIAELIDTMDDTESVNVSSILDNCQYLLNKDSSYILVAEIERTVVGFVNWTIRRTILHSGLSALIDEIIVTEKYRSRGIGRQLIYAVVKISEQLGCCEIEVSTERTNTSAIRFYEKCGFKKRGLLFEIDL